MSPKLFPDSAVNGISGNQNGEAGDALDDESDAVAILASIRNIIAPWFAVDSGSHYVLSVGDDGICRLHLDDECILHETSTASDMLDFVMRVDARITHQSVI
jgi:hypothetical protein